MSSREMVEFTCDACGAKQLAVAWGGCLGPPRGWHRRDGGHFCNICELSYERWLVSRREPMK